MKSCVVHAVVISFDVAFRGPASAPDWKNVTLSTGCNAAPTHWKQVTLMLPTPIRVTVGEDIVGSLRMVRDAETARGYGFDLVVERPGSASAHFDMR